MACTAPESPTTSQGDSQVCWVCLEEASAKAPLYQPCACPRAVHAQCLARWQLHSAGTKCVLENKEESYCRFCETKLPDWRQVLRPVIDPTLPVHPTMSVTFNGQVHHVQVRNGPGAYDAFLTDIRRIFGITEDHDMHLAFDCADPVTGALVKLNGAGSFHAAVHCATVSAAKRMRTAIGKRRRDGRRQMDGLHVADSASSLDLDAPGPRTQAASAAAMAAPQQFNGQASVPMESESAAGSCHMPVAAASVATAERAAAMRAEHRRMLQQMMRRVIHMRTAQADSDIVATSPDRLDALEEHLRTMLAQFPSS